MSEVNDGYELLIVFDGVDDGVFRFTAAKPKP